MTLNNDTLGITPAQQRGNELYLLARLALFVRPVPLWKAFYFSDTLDAPRWAVEACDRLLVRGEIVAGADDVLKVVDPNSAPILRATHARPAA